MKHVVLVGFMASGKSTIARALARRLGVRSIDTDAEIEREHGPIAGIFAHEGEARFRAYERAAVSAALRQASPSVIAVGGGAFVQSATREMLRRDAVTVFLDVGEATLRRRLARSRTHRPMLRQTDGSDAFDALYRAREPLYREADLTIACDGMTQRETVDAICAGLDRVRALR